MSRQNLVLKELEDLKNQINQAKQMHSNVRSRLNSLSSESQIASGSNLARNLSSFLPQQLVPKNVGHLNHVAWPFYYTLDFDLSATSDWPNLTSSTRQVRDFQISQEAAFLMMGVIRHAEDYNDAGDLGPLAVEFRDRQSSRFFNDSPIPIQMFGQKGYLSYLAMPMILMPNAFFEISLTTLLEDGVTQNTPNGSSGKHSFTMYGYRTRVQDAQNVLSSIFG